MTLTFYGNYLNHHQVLVADELFKLLGKGFHFVATLPRSNAALKGGLDYSHKSYCLLAGELAKDRSMAVSLAVESDVCIFGASSQEYAVLRARQCPNKLSFELGERWFKRGFLALGSSVFRNWYLNYLCYYRKANFYKLCCSSFTSLDENKIFAYRGKHYKWAYFTKVDEEFDDSSIANASPSPIVNILWCGRFLSWKHPELAVMLASRLKSKGYQFIIRLYGDDCLAAKYDKVFPKEKLKALIHKESVEDCVFLMGNKPNELILKAMRESDIFIFTSDKREGWGAVANESMANACAVVASDAIGSTMYLINDGDNGFHFKSQNVDSLTEKVEWLLLHLEDMRRMQHKAYLSMKTLWSPKKAAHSLMTLIGDLNKGTDSTIKEGPCSKA